MSHIIDFAEASSTTNVIAGFDIVGLDNSENIIRYPESSESIANGNTDKLMETANSFDFISSKSEGVNSLSLESTPLAEEAGIDLAESGDAPASASGEEALTLEFFSDDEIISELDLGNNDNFVRGSSDDGNVKYEEASGRLFVNGQELAQLDTELGLDDDSYEMF
ncbi:hypothetical protein H1P_1350012 [Hyella patelloides LEGE 07179]|uniref:Uncharacterized protein n=1 Tax=Hyella patelloides LEGE 07179 TaxID=945734 RepID=A0A563VLA0_9CYAN|nr:hypothetical protein [Hyella patelloides]VEP12127.1 hypothetical protein H1P_1350012 [Hyella patelloides LEGE 07179]